MEEFRGVTPRRFWMEKMTPIRGPGRSQGKRELSAAEDNGKFEGVE